MAALRSRVFSKAVQTILPRSTVVAFRSHPANHRNNVLWFRVCSSARYVFTSPRDSAHGLTRLQSRAQSVEEEEEEDEYSNDDSESLETLRRQHREAARKIHTTNDTKQFSEFDLDGRLVQKLESLGYKEPFAIQSKTLEHTLQGRDVIGRAVTGSGKTMAFSIPIVQKIKESSGRQGRTRSPKAIVISPTRELCMQIYRSIQELDPSVRCVAVYGGDSINRQTSVLQRGVDVVCATPGRLNDHIARGAIKIDQLEFLCLDEADELLTPNFKDQIEDVLRNSPAGRQMLLFSATMPPDIKRITRTYMKEPEYVDVSTEQKSHVPANIKHLCIRLPASQHMFAVSQLIRDYSAERCIVFTDTKIKAGEAARDLKRQGLKAEALHSDLSQSRRENIMGAFRTGRVRILTATDVAARGLDVPECDLVIQVGVPKNGVDYYIHRSGRTGRGGRDGIAVLLHTGNYADNSVIRDISKLVKIEHCKLEMSSIQEAMTSDILKKLSSVNADERSKSLETIQGLNLSPEKTQLMLASALSLLLKSDITPSAASPSFNADRSYRGDSEWDRRPHRQNSWKRYDSYDNRGFNNRNSSKSRSWRNSRNYDDGDYF